MRKLLFVFLLFAVPAFADGVTFTADGLGDIGKTDTFHQGLISLFVTGYSSPGVQADMWAKNQPAIGGQPEQGIGLMNEVDHEIAGTMFVQINVAAANAAGLTLQTLSVDSVQAGESYNVWGSNTAGQLGTLLGAGLTSPSFTFNNTGFTFISLSANAGDVTLDDANFAPPIGVSTPEGMGTLGFLVIGLAGLMLMGRKLTKVSP